MELYAEKLGFRYLKEFTLEALRKYRSNWPNENLSALKRLGLLRSFFRFGCDSGWIPDNPAKKLRNPKIVDRPTMPFDSEEMVRILTALQRLWGCEASQCPPGASSCSVDEIQRLEN